MRRHHHALLAFASFLLLAPGCIIQSSSSNDVCADNRCNSGNPKGPVHGLNATGGVDVTASEAWPGRPAEPAPLTDAEVAQACVALGACVDPLDKPAVLTGLCVGPDGIEERANPTNFKNERRSFVLRTALAAKSDCTKINAIETERPKEIFCEEDGCWWQSSSLPIPAVSCSGDIATLRTGDKSFTRDCSRAYQKCDPTSATGCTDRHTTACDPKATDRCDGDIRLGCSGNGRVSFRDCTRVTGGKCVDKGGGDAKCIYPSAGKCGTGASTCTTDGKVSVCVAGDFQIVDCVALGWTKCDAGRCVK